MRAEEEREARRHQPERDEALARLEHVSCRHHAPSPHEQRTINELRMEEGGGGRRGKEGGREHESDKADSKVWDTKQKAHRQGTVDRGRTRSGRAAEDKKGQRRAREVKDTTGRAQGQGRVDRVRTVEEKGRREQKGKAGSASGEGQSGHTGRGKAGTRGKRGNGQGRGGGAGGYMEALVYLGKAVYQGAGGWWGERHLPVPPTALP